MKVCQLTEQVISIWSILLTYTYPMFYSSWQCLPSHCPQIHHRNFILQVSQRVCFPLFSHTTAVTTLSILVVLPQHGAMESEYVNNELERLWKEATMATFEVLSQYLPRGTEEIYGSPIRITCRLPNTSYLL
jgi:hypothetical protein